MLHNADKEGGVSQSVTVNAKSWRENMTQGGGSKIKEICVKYV